MMLRIRFLILDFRLPIYGTQSALALINKRRRRSENRQSAIKTRQFPTNQFGLSIDSALVNTKGRLG